MAEPPPGLVPERLVGERIAGRFVVEKAIGNGPLSSAFRAHDERLHRRVTVKLFHPRHADDAQVVESQLAAASAVARLSHEHIALVIDRGEHDGMPLVVLEYVRGENLQERIDRFAPLAVGEVVGYALQIARALAYAHGHGVVHGNLRPANVLLTEEREVKLVDFGGGSYVAQLVGDPYAAPELSEVDAGAPAEPSDDIYSLGALVFVALTEQAPTAGIEPSEIQLMRPDVSPKLAATVARALAPDPLDRHATARELAAELSLLREVAEHSPLQGEDTQTFEAVGATAPDHAGEEAGAAPTVRETRPRRRPRRRRSPREARARLLAWSMVVLPLAALVLVGVMIAGERASDQVGRAETRERGPTAPVPIEGAVSFDPEGDGAERPDLVANAVDGDASTRWQTEGYDLANLNGEKEGVGLVLQLAEPANVQDVVILTELPGWRVQVLAADEPAEELEGWRPVSEPTAVRSGSRISVDLDGEETRFLLLWITKLSIDIEDTERFRARIGDVRVLATREDGPQGDG